MDRLPRGARPALHRLLDSAKVVILEGGRAVGKTTLALSVAEERSFGTVFDLSNPADFAALETDAFEVLSSSRRPILIDEAQLLDTITVAVKRVVDAVDRPGQFLLTGSSRIGRGALGGGDPLVGRAARTRLTSFTQSELAGSPSGTLSLWWTSEPDRSTLAPVDLADLTQRLTTGGLPSVALALGGTASPPCGMTRAALIEEYVAGVLTSALAGSRVDRARLTATFRYLAANPGQILNISRAASDLDMRAETVRSHLDLCESTFLLQTAPAVRPNEHQTATAHPRVFASDLALAAWAADTDPHRLVRQAALRGSLLENLVAHELLAQSGWGPTPARLMHWRDTRSGREVDLVLRSPSGTYLAFEVKSSSEVTARDAAGLQAFAAVAGEQFERGFVLHTGRLVTRLDDHIWAVPVASLFAPANHLTGT